MTSLVYFVIVAFSVIVGTIAIVSKRNFNKRFEIIERNFINVDQSAFQEIIHSLCINAKEYEEFQERVQDAINNLHTLQIEVPSPKMEDDKIKYFYDYINKYDTTIASTEQILLAILGPRELATCIVSLGDVLGDQLSQGVQAQISILKEGISNIDFHFDADTIIHFIKGISDYASNPLHHRILQLAIKHHEYGSAIYKLLFSGVKEALEPSLHLSDVGAAVKETLTSTISSTHDQLSDVLTDSLASDALETSINLPICTIAISAIREFSLLSASMTDVNSALKNAGIDIAFVTAGGTVGAKAGGAIGSLILPGLGTCVGAAIGGAVCAGIAKMCGNNIKALSLKSAISEYENTRKEMMMMVNQKTTDSLSTVQDFVVSKNKEMNTALTSLSKKMREYCSNDNIVYQLREITVKCENSMEVAYNSVARSIWFTKKYKTRMSKFYEDLQKLKTQEKTELNFSISNLLNTMRSIHVDSNSKEEICKMLFDQNKNWSELNNKNNVNLLAYACSATTIYQNALSEVIPDSIQKYNDLTTYIENWNSKLTTKLNNVLEEQRKLGKSDDAPSLKRTLSKVTTKIDDAIIDIENKVGEIAKSIGESIKKPVGNFLKKIQRW